MRAYSPDIAGIISCICKALVDESHGVEGCVLESSDNDHKDGEIYADISDGQGGMEQILIKIVPGKWAQW